LIRGAMAARLDFTPTSLTLKPMVSVARILEQSLPINIARVSAAHVGENVLVPVVVEIGEGNTVALLQMAEAGLPS